MKKRLLKIAKSIRGMTKEYAIEDCVEVFERYNHGSAEYLRHIYESKGISDGLLSWLRKDAQRLIDEHVNAFICTKEWERLSDGQCWDIFDHHDYEALKQFNEIKNTLPPLLFERYAMPEMRRVAAVLVVENGDTMCYR